MNKLTLLCTPLLLVFVLQSRAQTIYVDPVKGKAEAKGTITDPLLSLEKAMSIANSFTGKEPVSIKLEPGLYVLSKEMIVKTAREDNDTVKFTIEAVHMPDDEDWQPAKMPVIQ